MSKPRQEDIWYLSGDTVGCHSAGGKKVIIFKNIFDGKWVATTAVGKFKFGPKNRVESYGHLPAEFQAAAPEWRRVFNGITDPFRPIRSRPLE